jgi:hypothetical protein
MLLLPFVNVFYRLVSIDRPTPSTFTFTVLASRQWRLPPRGQDDRITFDPGETSDTALSEREEVLGLVCLRRHLGPLPSTDSDRDVAMCFWSQ